MTRTIPWPSKSTTTTQPKRLAATRTKQPRSVERSSRVEEAHISCDISRHLTPKPQARIPSTSPVRPLDPPLESFMKEGLALDDGFRMVEDEFLDVAKQFTQHLHAAEYQRMKKEAKSHNAETISSISRPVTIRMPEETRRKLESVARSKKQANVVRGLLGNQAKDSGSDSDSDEAPSAWIGTALHGLMDSPRKSTASLTKFGTITATTRAAAGFRRSRPLSQPSLSPSGRPNRQQTARLLTSKASADVNGDETASSDGDEDLDAPMRPLKVVALTERGLPSSRNLSKSSTETLTTSKSSKSVIVGSPEMSYGYPTSDLKHSRTNITTRSVQDSNARIARRLKQSRIQKVKEKNEAQKKRLDEIPTFL